MGQERRRICYGEVGPQRMWVCATITQLLPSRVGNSEFEFGNSKLPWPFFNLVRMIATWFIPCSPALLGCQARRERRKEHEHISKRTMLLLAGCIFQSKPDTAPPCIRSISTTSRALIQRGTSKYNFIPPITLSTKGRITISQIPSSCIPWDICFRRMRFKSRHTGKLPYHGGMQLTELSITPSIPKTCLSVWVFEWSEAEHQDASSSHQFQVQELYCRAACARGASASPAPCQPPSHSTPCAHGRTAPRKRGKP